MNYNTTTDVNADAGPRDPDDDFDDDEGEGEEYVYHDDEDGEIDFADPGGRSALRAATIDDPRIHPCPTCGRPNKLTLADKALGYQCDTCADRTEHGLDIYDY